ILRRFILRLKEFLLEAAASGCRSGGVSLAPGYQLVFVFAELTFDDLLDKIDGDIHIIACLLRTDGISLYGDRHLDLLTFLLHTEGYDDFCFRSEVPFKFSQFLFDSIL